MIPRRAIRAVGVACLFASCLGSSTAFAQYGLDTWTTTQGLPQNLVHSVLQTRDGYIWLTTFNGLVRFDGVRFTIFDKATTPGIATNRLGALFESRDGVLWVGSDAGLLRVAKGTFTTYTTEHGLPDQRIRGFTADETGQVWVLADDRIMRWNDGHFVRDDPGGVAVTFGTSEWNTEVFWGTDDTTLYRFTRGVLSRRLLPIELQRVRASRYAEDAAGTFWIATADGRIVRVDGDGTVSVHHVNGRSASPRSPTPAIDPLETSYRDHQGQNWMIRVGNDLERYLRVPDLGAEQEVAFRLSYEDREDTLWLTGDRGLHRVRRRAVTTYSRQHGLIDRNVYPVYEDREGAVWIGAWSSGLSRWKDDRFTNYTTADGLASGLISAMMQDRDGRFWVAAHSEHNGGLRVYRQGRFVGVDAEIVPPKSTVNVIYEDRSGTLWFGSSGGLLRYAGGVTTRYTMNDGLPSDDVHAIVEGANGELWLGLYGGLARLHDGVFSRWTERDGLPSNTVRALHFDADGVLWIGTYDGGLGRYKDGRFSRITSADGLFDAGAFQILEDDGGFLWMSSNRGIYRTSKRELNDFADRKVRRVHSLAFGTSDGLINAECNGGYSPAGIRDRQGRLWFPTQDGVAVIDPARIGGTATRSVPVTLESFLIDRTPVAFDGTVRIAPGQENFEIAYTGLSFIRSDRLTFRYRLNGLDRDWVDAGTRRTAYYSHVPPGTYTFTVMAANSEGIWSSATADLHVVIVPPFWRTWWFVSLSLVAIGGVAAAGYSRRVSALERARVAQETFSRQLIESQENERRRIAAELHDSLGQQLLVIKNRALLGTLNGQGARPPREQFDEILESATQSIEEVRQIAYNLRPYHLDRLGLTSSIEDMIERVSSSSGIEFSTDLAAIDGAISKAMEINLYRVVQESVNNIVKHSDSQRAAIRIARTDHRVTITIHDEGKGFDARGASKMPTPTRGFGMAGLAERVGMLGGTHTITSSPGHGTTVEIQVPVVDPGEERTT